jgi:hypothetical protein
MHPQAWNPIPNPIARQIQPIEPKSGMNSIDYPLPPRRPDGCASRTRGRGRGKDKPDVMAGGRARSSGRQPRGLVAPSPLVGSAGRRDRATEEESSSRGGGNNNKSCFDRVGFGFRRVRVRLKVRLVRSGRVLQSRFSLGQSLLLLQSIFSDRPFVQLKVRA